MKKIALLALIALFTFSCMPDNDSNCYAKVFAKANDLIAPDTVAVNQEFEIELFYIDANGCSTFSGFETTRYENTVTTKTIIEYTRCSCDVAGGVLSEPFKYTPTTSGTYLFRFNTDENEYVSKTIIVE